MSRTAPTTYFESGGPERTEDALKLSRERATELNIRDIIVTSSTGKSALIAAEVFDGTDCRIIACPFQKHLWKQYTGLNPELAEKCKQKGVVFLPDEPQIPLIDEERPDIVNTLRCFSQGVKVAVQVASMCVDTGIIESGKEVISLGGTGRGADSAIVLTANNHDNILKCRIKELICMPRA